MKCQAKTEVYSRVVGFYRPVQNWNTGKQAEYSERKEYHLDENQKIIIEKGQDYLDALLFD